MSEARSYERLKCVAFWRALLQAQDLDPVYTALFKAKLPGNVLARLLVAYWCLYHLGASARLAELSEKKFWAMLGEAAHNNERGPSIQLLPASAANRWPRGAERRHWRGKQALKSYRSLCELSSMSAENLVDYLAGGRELSDTAHTFQAVTARVHRIVGFGPWIAFKVADMLERVAGYPVDFNDCALGFYDEPAKGAALFMADVGGKGALKGVDQAGMVEWAVGKLRAAYKDLKAPPNFKRGINVQECETVLCKWKSHLGGHYPLGKDTREVHHGLEGWGDVAQQLQRGLSKLPYAPGKAT